MFMALLSQLFINFYSNYEATFEAKIMQLSDYDRPITIMPKNESVHGDILKDVFRKYERLVTETSGDIKQYTNISDSLLILGKEDLGAYRKDYIIGGNFEFPKIPKILGLPLPTKIPINVLNGMYNSIPKHSRPLSVNYMSNALLRHLDVSNSHQRKITTINHPLPFTLTVI